MVPKIVLPVASVSPSARIGKGTAVISQVAVGDAEVGEYCILASNSLVNSGSTVKDFVHLDCGEIVVRNVMVPENVFVKSGKRYKEGQNRKEKEKMKNEEL